MGACRQESGLERPAGEEDAWTMRLQTRAAAEMPGEDDYNENLIRKVDVYFFEDVNSAYTFCLRGVAAGTDGTLKVKVDEAMYGKSYTVYVIANGSESYSTEPETLAALQAKVIHTAWKDGLPDGKGDLKEESLWMHGQVQATLQRETPATITLKRAMAKVTLTPQVDPSITVNGVTYEPDLNSMEVTFVNAVSRTQLDGGYAVQADRDYLSRMKRAYTGSRHIPFYSYPNPAATTDRRDSYLILCVPWRATSAGGSSSYLDYYYHVPITHGEVTLEPNRYYQVNVKVGILGSLDPRDEVTLEPEFVVLDWYDLTVDADLSQYQYLVLDEYKSVLYNEESVLLPYISSSELVFGDGEKQTRIVSVEYLDYSKSGKIEECTKTLSIQEIIEQGYRVEAVNNRLKFSHPITTDMYAAYTITVEVGNEQGITRTWKITQYPSIYITGQKADGRLFVAGKYSNNEGRIEVSYNNHSLGSVRDPSTITGSLTGNDNWNNYTISVSAFHEGQDYAIGDPRSLTNDDLDMGSVLTYYRPTRKDDTQNIISPRFKIASSRGKTTSISFNNAQRRCASYQEDGFPAGRWRVPTEAEIQFIINLSADGKIPQLFDGEYWSASGRYYSSNNQRFEDGGNSPQSVRCVYDVWYWGDQPATDKNTFQWMDDPIE